MVWLLCVLVLIAFLLFAFGIEFAINTLAANTSSGAESAENAHACLTRRAKSILAAGWGIPIVWPVAALAIGVHPFTFATGEVGCLLLTAMLYCIVGLFAVRDPHSYLEGDATSAAANRCLLYPGVVGSGILATMLILFVVVGLIWK